MTKKFKAKFHVKKGDKVVVISGSHKTDTPHEVLSVLQTGEVIVKDINVRLKNLRRTKDAPKGGQIRKEFPIAISNVALWDPEAKKAVRTRKEGTGRAKKRASVATGKVLGE